MIMHHEEHEGHEGQHVCFREILIQKCFVAFVLFVVGIVSARLGRS